MSRFSTTQKVLNPLAMFALGLGDFISDTSRSIGKSQGMKLIRQGGEQLVTPYRIAGEVIKKEIIDPNKDAYVQLLPVLRGIGKFTTQEILPQITEFVSGEVLYQLRRLGLDDTSIAYYLKNSEYFANNPKKLAKEIGTQAANIFLTYIRGMATAYVDTAAVALTRPVAKKMRAKRFAPFSQQGYLMMEKRKPQSWEYFVPEVNPVVPPPVLMGQSNHPQFPGPVDDRRQTILPSTEYVGRDYPDQYQGY